MTKEEATQIVRANKALYPCEYRGVPEADLDNAAMLMARSLANCEFSKVKEAYTECVKVCARPVKVSDLWSQMQSQKQASNEIYRKLEVD